MKNSKGGRPANNTKEDLMKKLLEYTKEHPDQSVKLSELEKATGIKRYVWEYNLKDEIEKINHEIRKVEIAMNGREIPSAEQILMSCRGDEVELTARINDLVNLVREMSKYQEAEMAMNVMKRDYENRLEKKDCIIREKEKTIDKLFEQINRLLIDSENPNTRKEKGIKDNFLKLTPENMEMFNEMAEKLLL